MDTTSPLFTALFASKIVLQTCVSDVHLPSGTFAFLSTVKVTAEAVAGAPSAAATAAAITTPLKMDPPVRPGIMAYERGSAQLRDPAEGRVAISLPRCGV